MERDTSPSILDELPGWSDPPGLGRSMVIGATVGVVLSFIGVTLGMLALGIEFGSSLGLGIFTAFWGGLGFGTMVGGVVYAFGVENDAHDASTRDATAHAGDPVVTSEPTVTSQPVAETDPLVAGS